jgi:uncharacterized protein DUF6158
VAGTFSQVRDVEMNRVPELGVPAPQLTRDDLLRELASIHRTRNETLRHGSLDALDEHNQRMVELEAEYLRRFPEREVDPSRVRD